ncbi:uncharacterized protein [Diadema antillarum]|uniref:uncharacterized protein n=1 Tax=Diadema antillarum TaxID=105358 RepID=UPI003A87AFE0
MASRFLITRMVFNLVAFSFGFTISWLVASEFQVAEIHQYSRRDYVTDARSNLPPRSLGVFQFLGKASPEGHIIDTRSQPIPTEKPRNRVVVTTTNRQILNVTKNWLESLKRSRVNDHVFIIAEDKSSFATLRALRQRKVTVEYANTKRSSLNRAFTIRRIVYILRFLLNGVDVLFSVSESVWLREPTPVFTPLSHDVYFSSARESSMCDGFAYYAATEPTMKLLNEFVFLMKRESTTETREALTQALAKVERLKWKVFDEKLISNGRFFEDDVWRTVFRNTKPYVIRTDDITDLSSREDYLRAFDLWYL